MQPLILGVRHHSPGCAALVAQRIRALRPAWVLIEGPTDFNDRLDELYLPHRLPVAIYSYLSGDGLHCGSWSPFAEHSPEWQALVAGKEVGAQVRFIDLPAWHEAFADLENRYADAADEQAQAQTEAYERALTDALAVQGRDAVWDHLFEDGCSSDELALRLSTWFARLRPATERGSPGNQQREQMMARWIAWAMQQATQKSARQSAEANVVVVCGGYHAPALAQLWHAVPPTLDPPEVPLPTVPQEAQGQAPGQDGPLRYGSFLVPYTFKRLDAFTGYASGMPSPGWYQWVWKHGHQGASKHALRQVVQRLRDKKLTASTADLIAVHARAHGLMRLRGHPQPLRSDWLDALAGGLVKDALDAPLPWTYRGPLRPGTDPVLVQVMDVLAGDTVGQLAPGTPQPPLVHSVRADLEACGIELRGTLHIDLLKPAQQAQSRLLHRLLLLRLPGIVRSRGPAHALSGERTEVWTLSQPLEQQAALIEAGAWGATLADAARARLEDDMRAAQGHIGPLAECLNRAAWAGLAAVSDKLLGELQIAIAKEPRFEALAPALGMLHGLMRHGHMLGMEGAPVLRVLIESGLDRCLWLLEPPATVATGDVNAHLQGWLALRHIVADHLAERLESGPVTLALQPARALAVWRRKAADAQSAPVSRGAAIGTLLGLHIDEALAAQAGFASLVGVAEAMQFLQTMPAAVLGDALTGLLALGREALATEPGFVAGMDHLLQTLDNSDFVLAMPALRGAFAWLPTQERGALAEQVLALHNAQHLSRRALTARLTDNQSEILAAAARAESAVLAQLQRWGIEP